ncbi:MAG: hypothetical protein A2176_07415 [Spirochaetes bacterium RBG_13_51_14]|nr:MAG: hypothetical protein A2176_07415 [Spirochaetes bacterium RBG_13_51_14]
MFSNSIAHFLRAYNDSNYVLKQKSKVIFSICVTILIMLPVIGVINFIRGTSIEVQLPLFIGFICTGIIIVLLKRGYFNISAHLMLIIALLAAWGTMFFDTDTNSIVVLDTIVFIPGLMALTPLVITQRKSAILIYTAGNIGVFVIFAFVAGGKFGISDDVLIDYLADTIITMIAVGVLSYHICKINHNALDKAVQESDRNEKQFRLIRDLKLLITETSQKLTAHSWDLTVSADSFLEQSQSQASAVEELTATSEEVSGGVDLVSENVEGQYNSMRSLLGNIGVLTENLRLVADRIQHTISLTDEVSDVANRGGDALNAMSQSLTTVNESSGKMTGIVGMIGDISDKTNLLSLNAAIEAARAGEAGRGFAVVADEISKLADQTASSIKEIDGLIKANVEEIGRGMANINETVTTIMQIIQGVSTISIEIGEVWEHMEKQKEINRKVNEEADSVQNLSDEMQKSIESQKYSMNEIVKSITNLNEITQIYSDGAQKLSAKSRDLDIMVRKLHDLAKTSVD